MRFTSNCVLVIVTCFCLSGCSVWMEAHRPTPIDLSQFVVGEHRSQIVERIGPPLTSVKEKSGDNCDVYRLYTKGIGTGAKTAIAVGEGAADVFTLGLSEILFTPAEGGTKNEKHPVVFCYDKQAALVSVRQKQVDTQ